MKMNRNNRCRWLVFALCAMVLASRVPAQATDDNESFVIKGDAVKGAVTFKMYCAMCHGETGKGDGIAAAGLNPKPKDLSDYAVMSKISDHEVFIVIRDGGPAAGLSPLMVGWMSVLQDEQKVHDVAAFVRSLAVGEEAE